MRAASIRPRGSRSFAEENIIMLYYNTLFYCILLQFGANELRVAISILFQGAPAFRSIDRFGLLQVLDHIPGALSWSYHRVASLCFALLCFVLSYGNHRRICKKPLITSIIFKKMRWLLRHLLRKVERYGRAFSALGMIASTPLEPPRCPP